MGATNFSTTTPAAPAGYANAVPQTDGAGNVSFYFGPGLPQDIAVFWPVVGTNAQLLMYVALNRGIKFPATAPLSHAVAKTAATASTVFTISKNGTPFCTVTFAISGTVGTFTQASDSTFVAGDILEIDGPATADATLAGFSINLEGLRT